MKKYKLLLDTVLLAGLGLMSALAIAPKTFVMPTNLQMLLLAFVLSSVAGFLVLLWREQPNDEREAHNQVVASRAAYIVGAIVLIIALLFQSLSHHIDPALPLTLLAMIGTKLIVQRRKDNS